MGENAEGEQSPWRVWRLFKRLKPEPPGSPAPGRARGHTDSGLPRGSPQRRSGQASRGDSGTAVEEARQGWGARPRREGDDGLRSSTDGPRGRPCGRTDAARPPSPVDSRHDPASTQAGARRTRRPAAAEVGRHRSPGSGCDPHPGRRRPALAAQRPVSRGTAFHGQGGRGGGSGGSASSGWSFTARVLSPCCVACSERAAPGRGPDTQGGQTQGPPVRHRGESTARDRRDGGGDARTWRRSPAAQRRPRSAARAAQAAAEAELPSGASSRRAGVLGTSFAGDLNTPPRCGRGCAEPVNQPAEPPGQRCSCVAHVATAVSPGISGRLHSSS